MDVCEALRESRNLSGKSQEYMALEIGIARKTVQNWERGTSEPTIGQAVAWFKALDISPLPYLLQIVHNDMDRINGKDDFNKLKASLNKLLQELPEEGVRQLLYLFYGDHGSSPRAILNMVTAHLQTPMEARVTQGSVILKNYEMAQKKHILTAEDHVQPNVELLKKAINMGEEAAVKNLDAYILSDVKKIY